MRFEHIVLKICTERNRAAGDAAAAIKIVLSIKRYGIK